MKISKDNHHRMAVGRENDSPIGGITYTTPNYEISEPSSILKKKDNSVKVLYNIFTPVQVGTKPKEKKPEDDYYYEYLIKKANYDLKKKYESEGKLYKEASKTLNEILFYKRVYLDKNKKEQKERCLIKKGDLERKIKEASKIDERVVPKEIVSLAIRKSLRSEAEGLVCLMKNIGNDNIVKEDLEKIYAFYERLEADYNKIEKGKDKYIRAIKNQNLLVQPQKENEDLITLPIPSDQGKKEETRNIKTDEKKGLEVFLSKFAQLDEKARTDCLRKVSRLIDVYFSAPENYEKGNNVDLASIDSSCFNIWEHHEKRRITKENFVEIPEVFKESDLKTISLLEKKNGMIELTERIRNRNISCYRFAVAVQDNDDGTLFFEDKNINMFWIHHIENAVERILKNRLEGNMFKLQLSYLTEKVWKDVLNLISTKYIGLGKAVFNFAMDEAFLEKKETDIELGKISEKAINGLNSFDYEMIKARETFQRELAVNVAYAANNLSRAVLDPIKIENEIEKQQKEKEAGTRKRIDEFDDILLLNKNQIKNVYKGDNQDDLLKNILQFFGGKSKSDIELIKNNYHGADDYAVNFLFDIKEQIYSLRNDSFHFRTNANGNNIGNTELIATLFKKETQKSLQSKKDKFHSNNLPMFYPDNELENVLNHIYKNDVTRNAMVPAFNRVIVRKNLSDFISQIMEVTSINLEEKNREQWDSALYYLLKEIYYNDFLVSDKVNGLFLDSIEELKGKDPKEQRAVDNFKNRCKEIQGSFVDVCQQIMTDYNIQNNQKRKVRTSNDSVMDKAIYSHFPLLLTKTIAIAFGKYLKSEDNEKVYGFIFKSPVIKTMPTEDNFLPKWTSKAYAGLIERTEQKKDILRWYITGKFMSSRYLNLLAGSMRSYIQYANDIINRAKKTENSLHIDEKARLKNIEEAVKIIDICINTSGVFSNEVYDYFKDEDDYAEYLGKYVDYKKEIGLSSYASLQAFCQDENGEQIFDVYCDAKNPKVNRNIIISKLFSPDRILEDIVDKVTEKELKDYYKDSIATYRKNGKCNNSKEQKGLLKYQKLKNHVELRELVEYGEIANDLLGQLINWSFLRERDLLYFQLGFHYICIYNDSEKPEAYKTIKMENGSNIKNAILYQILGMYVNGIGVYSPTNNMDRLLETNVIGSAGSKVNAFMDYTGFLNAQIGKDNGEKEWLYYAGMEVFENTKEHDNIIELRNYIDHFKLYSVLDRSILDLYSEIFDRFFTYDMKYQKNVINLLMNILAKYKIVAEVTVGSGNKKYGNRGGEKQSAKIVVRELKPDQFTYKFENETLHIDAKDERFLNTVAKLLERKAETKDSSIKIRTSEEKIENQEQNRKQEEKSKSKKINNYDSSSKGKYDTGSLSYNPFADFLKNYQVDK